MLLIRTTYKGNILMAIEESVSSACNRHNDRSLSPLRSGRNSCSSDQYFVDLKMYKSWFFFSSKCILKQMVFHNGLPVRKCLEACFGLNSRHL